MHEARIDEGSVATDPALIWGKSAALAWFGARLRSARVPCSRVLTRERWQREAANPLAEIASALGCERFAVRSDSTEEDQFAASNAGRFTSCLDVSTARLASAVDQVFSSMTGSTDDAVLIQPMIGPAICFGVASTHRVKDGSPWYCVEFSSASAIAVTAGQADGRLMAVARERVHVAGLEGLNLPDPLPAILSTMLEIEALAPGVPLEIEFALVSAVRPPELVLLQVRPLATARRWPRPIAPIESPPLALLGDVDRETGIVGRRTLLSLMSDWNPAELLGTHPRPLALSLFEHLIANGIWWEARARLGYCPPPHKHIALLQPVQGRPYVDVRRSANSLLPSGLGERRRRLIVDTWLDRLEQTPAWHDKVEFAVFRTARDFTARDVLGQQWAPLLGSAAHCEWEAQLGDLTANAIRLVHDARLLQPLRVLAMTRTDGADWPELLSRCRMGTGGFAALARLAFIAEAQLRSAVERGALSRARAHALRAASASVSRLLVGTSEANSASTQESAHLRPGSFDITSALRKAEPAGPHRRALAQSAAFALTGSESHALRQLLREAGFDPDPQRWVDFVLAATRGREWAKFVFTRHLSAALERIADHFERLGLDRITASWLRIDEIEAAALLPDRQQATQWRRQADAAAHRHERERQSILSPLLTGPRDGWLADSFGMLPNFVGSREVSAPLVSPESDGAPTPPLDGAIVLLRHADPGHDWLFEHNIVGLITAWGGSHSHMAIRCAEFGLTAAIGCGEALFRRARRSNTARIDPLQGSLWLL